MDWKTRNRGNNLTDYFSLRDSLERRKRTFSIFCLFNIVFFQFIVEAILAYNEQQFTF